MLWFVAIVKKKHQVHTNTGLVQMEKSIQMANRMILYYKDGAACVSCAQGIYAAPPVEGPSKFILSTTVFFAIIVPL